MLHPPKRQLTPPSSFVSDAQRGAHPISTSISGLRASRYQTWGVFQVYYAEGILAGTSPSTLGLLGSIPGAVGFRISFVDLTGDADV